jgi:hypothetical protein
MMQKYKIDFGCNPIKLIRGIVQYKRKFVKIKSKKNVYFTIKFVLVKNYIEFELSIFQNIYTKIIQ